MNLIFLIILFPIINFLILSFLGNKISKKQSTIIVIIGIIIPFIIINFITIDFINLENDNYKIIFKQNLWNWIYLKNIYIPIKLYLDNLSIIIIYIILTISCNVIFFSIWYMHKEKGYSRYFAYINLFIANMLLLILSDNLLIMYLSWELVGICSYLLISFYNINIKYINYSIKSFIINKIGDLLLLISIFIIYKTYHTFNFEKLNNININELQKNNINIILSFLMISGILSKSSQVPMHTWLPDAMCGPTPASALIHASTMIISGVYLLSRLHNLIFRIPNILYIINIIGSITIIISSLIALFQKNIKKILAYSTMSQIGYMFIAIGSKSWKTSIFHLIIHSFCKSLLFLSSGSLILTCKKETNIFKISKFKKKLTLIYYCFIISSASISSFPIITSGFYSKDHIIFKTILNGDILYIISELIGCLLTSLYIYRMIYIIFYKKKKNNINIKYNYYHHIPLIILLLLSTFIGSTLIIMFNKILNINNIYYINSIIINIITIFINIISIILFYLIFIKKIKITFKSIYINNIILYILYLFKNNLLFDYIYKKIFINNYIFIVKLLQNDPLNKFTNNIYILINLINKIIIKGNNGQLKWYIISICLGSIIILQFLN